jgi:hypothetical protein
LSKLEDVLSTLFHRFQAVGDNVALGSSDISDEECLSDDEAELGKSNLEEKQVTHSEIQVLREAPLNRLTQPLEPIFVKPTRFAEPVPSPHGSSGLHHQEELPSSHELASPLHSFSVHHQNPSKSLPPLFQPISVPLDQMASAVASHVQEKQMFDQQLSLLTSRIDNSDSFLQELQTLLHKQAYEIQKLYQRIGLQRLDTAEIVTCQDFIPPSPRLLTSRSQDPLKALPDRASPSRSPFSTIGTVGSPRLMHSRISSPLVTNEVKTSLTSSRSEKQLFPLHVDTIVMTSDQQIKSTPAAAALVPSPAPRRQHPSSSSSSSSFHSSTPLQSEDPFPLIQRLSSELCTLQEKFLQSQHDHTALLASLEHSHELFQQELSILKETQSEDLIELNSQLNAVKDQEMVTRGDWKEKQSDLEKRFNELDKEISLHLLPRDEIERGLYSLSNEIRNVKKAVVDKETFQRGLEKKVELEEYER